MALVTSARIFQYIQQEPGQYGRDNDIRGALKIIPNLFIFEVTILFNGKILWENE